MVELFDPTNGHAICTVPRVVALAIVRSARKKGRYLDYAKPGEGWTTTNTQAKGH